MIGGRRWVAPALVVTILVALAVGSALVRAGGRDEPRPDPVPAFPQVEALRAAIAHCTEELADEEERFRAHEALVDSLRAAVTAQESDERTVPAEEFEAYLETFDAYNQSVRDWHDRAAALEARWEECRDLTERHNAVVDSLTARTLAEPAVDTG